MLLTDIVEGNIDFPGWGNFRGRLEYAIRHNFRHIRLSQAAKGYEDFAKYHVKPGDVILNFNYYVASERELKLAGRFQIVNGYGFEIGRDFTPSSQVRVLKLHGSANWIASILGGVGPGSFCAVGNDLSLGLRPVIPTDELEFLGYDGICDPCFTVGGGFLTPVILPTLSKEFYFKTSLGIEWQDFWDSLWTQAKVALEQAENMFLLGYSMPLADKRARELILLNSRKDASITICCCESNSYLCEQFRDAGFREIVSLENIRFEEWAADNAI